MDHARPKVVVVGAGFGGLWAVKTLSRAPVDVVLIDRQNYHLFQPLLYQVATAELSPAEIAEPIRSIVGGYRNVTVMLNEVRGIDMRSAQSPRRKRDTMCLTIISCSRPARVTLISATTIGKNSRRV